MDFEQLIDQRYSVRDFKPEHLSQAVLDKIIAAGHKAPTGCNYQPQRILVLNTDEAIAKLRQCTKCHFNAPTALLVCHNKTESWKRIYDGALSSPVDATIVTTYTMLAAQNEGVGSCWVGVFNADDVANALGLPKEVRVTSLLPIGYPADDAKPLEMHSQYRDLDDTVTFL